MFKIPLSKILLVLFFVGTILVVVLNLENRQNLGVKPEAKVKIGGTQITVEVVDTAEEMEQGLSGKEFLAKNSGMYFDLGKRKTGKFWMKDMKFPLDIIWIDNGKIVGIEKNAPVPAEAIPTFTSKTPVTHVLEVNAGFCEENNIRVGDQVEINSL